MNNNAKYIIQTNESVLDCFLKNSTNFSIFLNFSLKFQYYSYRQY